MPASKMFHPIPGGELQLLDYFGRDLDFVNAAKVSFDNASSEMRGHEEGLVNFLIKNKHASPFEHGQLRFYVKAPIFVFREWHRHRTQAYNEWSARYSKLEPEFYIPENFRKRVGKPGAYTYEEIDDIGLEVEFARAMSESYAIAYQTYEGLLARDVAPEIARCVLPVGTFSKMWATVNPRNCLNFLALRAAPNAQLEIRLYAEAVENCFRAVYPVTWNAWNEAGRCSL
jgi:thymidylate synthase (FAD)